LWHIALAVGKVTWQVQHLTCNFITTEASELVKAGHFHPPIGKKRAKTPVNQRSQKKGKWAAEFFCVFQKSDFRYTKGLCTNLYYSPCEMKNKKRVIIQSSQCKLAICLALGGPSQKHGKRRYY